MIRTSRYRYETKKFVRNIGHELGDKDLMTSSRLTVYFVS